MKRRKCGAENSKPASRWTGGKGTKEPMKVQRYVCSSCGSSFVSRVDSAGKVKTVARDSSV